MGWTGQHPKTEPKQCYVSIPMLNLRGDTCLLRDHKQNPLGFFWSVKTITKTRSASKNGLFKANSFDYFTNTEKNEGRKNTVMPALPTGSSMFWYEAGKPRDLCCGFAFTLTCFSSRPRKTAFLWLLYLINKILLVFKFTHMGRGGVVR